MFLQEKETRDLVKVMDIQSLINPVRDEITIRVQAGEEEQDPKLKRKDKLVFPSGEDLPRCWLDADYKRN